MKKLFLIVAVAIFSLGTVNAFAQETTTPATEETAVVEETVVDEVPASDTQLAEAKPMHQVLMQKFLEGGWEWMLPVLLCLVFGLAIAIERMLYLSLSTINSKKLIAQVEEALKKGGIEAAKEVCRNKRGPVASIFYQGLDRYNQGLDSVEKAVVSYGSVQTGRGIKVALLTTLLGLIAAVILQLFYNYIVSKIDSLVNDMEDSSITLMDILTAYKK